jgi:hypothetical protein
MRGVGGHFRPYAVAYIQPLDCPSPSGWETVSKKDSKLKEIMHEPLQ